MKQRISRIERRGLVRWSLGAVFLVILIAVAPEYWAAERLPRSLWMVRGAGTLALLALTGALVWMRHESARRQFPLHVAMATIAMAEAVLKVGLTPLIAAMLVVWVVVIWVEWQRTVEDERRFA